MISDTSKRCFISVINVCYILNVIPYKLVTPVKNGIVKLQISPRLKLYKINVAWNLTSLFIVVIILIHKVVQNNFEPLLTILIVGILILITFVVAYQFLILISYEDLLVRLNGNQVVQHKLSK